MHLTLEVRQAQAARLLGFPVVGTSKKSRSPADDHREAIRD